MAMENSRRIAGLVGPSLTVITTSELLHWRIWAGVAPSLVFLNGALLFVTGLAIVAAHNVWTRRWPVLITLIGWAAMAGGAARLFAPEAPQPTANWASFTFVGGLGLAGLFLSLKAWIGPPATKPNSLDAG